MRIHSRVVFDFETGRVLEEEGFEHSGSLALCDRSLHDQGQQAGKTATQTGAQLGATGAGILSGILPTLQRSATGNAPGFGAAGLSNMMTQAALATGAETGKSAEDARLRAMRTGNVAGAGAVEAAGAEGATRAYGGGLQDILAQNEKLKEMQRSQALGELGDIYKTDVGEGVRAQSLVPSDINAATQAEKVGWLQNAIALGQLGINAFSALARTGPGTTPSTGG